MNEQLDQSRTSAGYLFAIGSTLLWAGNMTLARGLSSSIDPLALSFFRWTLACLAILPFSLKHIIAGWPIIRKKLGYFSIVAFLGVTAFATLVYMAGRTTTALNLSLISITFPIFIIIFSRIFLKERISGLRTAGIVFVLAGVLLLITKGNIKALSTLSFAPGDALVLLSSLAWAVYSILLRKKPKELNIWALQGTTFFLGWVFLAPFFFFGRGNAAPIAWNATIVLSIIYVALMASLAAFILWNKAVERLGASRAGMVYYSMPLFSGLLAYLILGESVGLYHLLSALLIVPGIVIANYSPNIKFPTKE
ncbi:MAG: DMT family transporter [Spirochaetales bacterium]|nr:DMT family transporter [Spirochaetales bacterium]